MTSSPSHSGSSKKDTASSSANQEEIIACELCGNPIESCMCACPYCGKLDKCECCILDAVTGG